MRLYQVIRWLAANRKRIIFCMQWLYWIKSVYDDTRVSTSFGKRLRKYICIIIVVYSLACNAKKCDFTHIFGPGARAMHDMVCIFLYVPCTQVKSHAIVRQLRVNCASIQAHTKLFELRANWICTIMHALHDAYMYTCRTCAHSVHWSNILYTQLTE